MKKRDRLLISIELLFTLSFLSIIGYMLNIPSGQSISSDITLKDYPRPFLKSDNYNFIFTTSDSINQEEYNCALSILSGMKEISSINPEQDLVPIGDGISNNHLKSVIRSRDLSSLQDSTVSIASDSVNVHDELDLGIIGSSSLDASSPSIESSLTKNKEYQSSVYLNAKKSSISYHYVFDNTVDLSQVSEDSALMINFLGNDLTITKIGSDTEFTGYIGAENLMNINDQVSVSGKTIVLDNIGQDSVIVSVDGKKEVIKNGEAATVEGIQIVVKDILFNDASSTASLVIGKGIADSYKDGQTYGDCTSECFVWDVNSLLSKQAGDIYSSGGPTIGIRNDFDMAGEVGVKSCIDLPNKFISICFDSLNTELHSNYRISKGSVDVSSIFPHLSSQDIIQITSGHSNGLEIKTSSFLTDKSGSKKASIIYLRPNSSNTVDVLYDDSGQVKWAGSYSATNSVLQFASVSFGKTSGDDIKISSVGDLSSLDIIFAPSGTGITNDDITIRTKSNLNGISKLLYGQDDKDISSYELDQRSRYGIIISDIKNGVDDEDIELRIPDNQVRANIKINGQSISKSQPATVPEIIKGADLTEYNQNIIAIGKSNQLYAKLVPEGWQYKQGEAILRLFNNNGYYVLLVAGTEDEDLSRACSVLSNYYQNKDKLKGLAIKV